MRRRIRALTRASARKGSQFHITYHELPMLDEAGNATFARWPMILPADLAGASVFVDLASFVLSTRSGKGNPPAWLAASLWQRFG